MTVYEEIFEVIKARNKHEEYKWISEEEVKEFNESTIKDFKDTLKKVFAMWDEIFKEE